MKIYIAGKVTGDEHYLTKFTQAARTVTSLGHIPLTSAALPQGLTEADYMRISLAMIESSDLVLFLPDFIQSAGANIEYLLCQKTGKPWDYFSSWTEMQEDDET